MPELKSRRGGADGGVAISCAGLSMAYVPGVWTLRGVDLNITAGTVTAVAGENGAGKSTLYRILAGLQAPTRGRISVGGTPLQLGRGRDQGVVYVPQELAPCPDLRVYENLFLGSELMRPGGILKRGAMIEAAAEAAARYEVKLDPKAHARSVSPAGLQVLEIIKSIRTPPRVWILDEPTSSLADAQVEHLFQDIVRMRNAGVAVLYTTHRMDEIHRLADRVIVLRDGGLVLDEAAQNVQQVDIIHAMLGRKSGELYPTLPPVQEAAPAALEVRDMTIQGLDGTFDLTVRAGEVLGVAGLVGAGRSELLEGIFGMRQARGSIKVDGRSVPPGEPAKSIKAGVALVPEDRKQTGLVGELSICDNMTLPWLQTFGRILSHASKRRASATHIAERTQLRYNSIHQRVSRLSGGNQQKVLIGRTLVGKVRVLLLDEPTRGVDVGARAEIYETLVEAARDGLAILMVSSDRDEVVNLSHRILVMRDRRLVGEVSRDVDDPRTELLSLSLGLTDEISNDAANLASTPEPSKPSPRSPENPPRHVGGGTSAQ